MKKLITLFVFLFFIGINLNVQAQLSGIKWIPAQYSSIASAITALNSNGVGFTGVVFNVAAGHTETSSNLVIAITSNPPTSSKQVIFKKAGTGANPLIIAEF